MAPLPDPTALVVALFAGPLLVAAVWDAALYRIPNLVCLVLAAGFGVAALIAPGEVDWVAHLGASAAVLAAGFALFAFGLVGGGDAKLLAATALWFDLARLPEFLLRLGLASLALVVILLAARRVVAAGVLMVPAAAGRRTPRLLTEGQAVPFGISIGAAAVLSLPWLPVLAGLG